MIKAIMEINVVKIPFFIILQSCLKLITGANIAQLFHSAMLFDYFNIILSEFIDFR